LLFSFQRQLRHICHCSILIQMICSKLAWFCVTIKEGRRVNELNNLTWRCTSWKIGHLIGLHANVETWTPAMRMWSHICQMHAWDSSIRSALSGKREELCKLLDLAGTTVIDAAVGHFLLLRFGGSLIFLVFLG
jgi:hypothetical protein